MVFISQNLPSLIVELNAMFEIYTFKRCILMILIRTHIGTLTEYFNGINDIVHYKGNEEKRILFIFTWLKGE